MPTAAVGTELWYQVQGEGEPILLLPGQEQTRLVTSELGRIACPTLVVAGDNDYFIPASFSKIIHRAIPGSRYVEIPGGGHIPFIEKPRETVAAVLGFIDSLGGAERTT